MVSISSTPRSTRISRMPWSCSTRLRVRVDFPAPDGEERIRRTPRRAVIGGLVRPAILLDVLNLFAELLDDGLEVEPDP